MATTATDLVLRNGHGQEEPYSEAKLRRSLAYALIETNLPLEEIVLDAIDLVRNGMTTEELYSSITMDFLSRSMEDPAYETAARNLLLGRIYKQTFGKEAVHQANMQTVYTQGVRQYLETGLAFNLLDPEKVKVFMPHVDELAAMIDQTRDGLLPYNGLFTLYSRYLLKEATSKKIFEAPQYLFLRVAMGVAYAETLYGNEKELLTWTKKFYDKISSLHFLPSTPTLFNALTNMGQLSSCFVLPVDDSLTSKKPGETGILDSFAVTAKILQTGGGIGIPLTKLRPEGDVVHSTAGVASGPVSFAKWFDMSVLTMKQGGKRRGAMVSWLEPWHLDIYSFIHAKDRENPTFKALKCGVMFNDELFRRAAANDEWYLFSPRECPELVDSYGDDFKLAYEAAIERAKKGEVTYKVIKAKKLLDDITYSAATTGEPWTGFKDAVNMRHPVPSIGTILAFNPCLEVPIVGFESCNLSSVNLARHIGPDGILWDRLAETTQVAARFLDDVIGANRLPDDRLVEANQDARKYGLGVMGYVDFLATLGVAYGSDKAVSAADALGEYITYHAIETSADLAQERGSFPQYSESLWAQGKLPIDTWQEVFTSREMSEPTLYNESIERRSLDWEAVRAKVQKGMRNATTFAIAPTATISIIAGVAQSIEPLFGLAFTRNNGLGKFVEVFRPFRDWVVKEGVWDEIEADVLRLGTIANVESVPEEIRAIYKTAQECEAIDNLRTSAAWTKWADQGISQNLYFNTHRLGDELPAAVADAYLKAYEYGLKSTYYVSFVGGPEIWVPKYTIRTEFEPSQNPVDPNGEFCESCAG